MHQIGLRKTLLGTSSALALIVGLEGSAAAQCAIVNQAGGVDNSGTVNCITYDNGLSTTGNVINETTGTLNASGPYPPNNPGTASGISVIKSGTVLNGSITNNGSITVSRNGINIGEGATGSPPTNSNAHATVTGSIINNGTISGYNNQAIVVTQSVVLGSVINALGAVVSGPQGIGVSGTTLNGATIGGSVINSGSINASVYVGINVSKASVGGGITNSGTITAAGFDDISVVNGGTVAGSIVNTGTLVDTNTGAAGNIAVYIGGQSIGGSVLNSGTISGGFGIAITGSNVAGHQAVIGGNVSNSGTITARSASGIALFNTAVRGALINSGAISAATAGIMVVNTSGVVAAATVAGGITNSGSITSTGTGSAGIAIAGGSISQGITNAATGAITAINGSGIYVGDVRGTTVTIASSVAGGILNQGMINAQNGINVLNSTVSGSITNATGATITSSANGINVAATRMLPHTASVSGSIINDGTINAGGVGIDVAVGGSSNANAKITISGSIINNGSITAKTFAAIAISEATVGGSIINNGSIVATNFTVAISVANGGSIGGSIVNNGSIATTNSPYGAAIQVLPSTPGNPETITGSIVNMAGGTMTGGYGIQVFGTNATARDIITGGITNSGTITAGYTGVQILSATIGGAVMNSGTIAAAQNGIQLANLTLGTTALNAGPTSIAGGVTNSGNITSTGAGFAGILLDGASVVGGITNAAGGTISAAQGVGIYVGNTGKVTFSTGATHTINGGASSVAGGILNQGTINAKTGIVLAGGALFSGGITNTGIISASATGINISGTPAVSIFDSGTIIGAGGTAIQFGAGTNTLTLGPGFAITGNVVGAGSDVFQLGGSGTGSFNLNTIGTQYTGFGTFTVTSATWVATGSSSQNWSISSGATLQLGNGTTNGSISGNIADNATLAVDPATGSTVTLAGMISGSGALAGIGSGATLLTGANSYGGGTTLTSGTLIIGNNSALGTGVLAMAAGTTLSFSNTANFSVANNITVAGDPNFTPPSGTTQTLSGVISDGASPGVVNMQGPGTLVLSGVNTYSGGTLLTGGVLQATNNSAVGTGLVSLNGGTLQSGAAGLVLANAFAINTTGGTVDTQANTLTLGGSIGNGNGTTGALTKIGGGTLILSGADTYTGATNINAGTLQAGAANVFAPASLFTVASGATLALNNFNESLVSLAGAGNVTLGSGALTLTNASSLFSGVLSGAGSLSLTAGSETLSGVNTYTGGTSLNGGTLVAGNNSALGAGTVTLNGGILQSGAAGLTLANAFAINTTGGTVDTQANTLTLGGSIANGNGTTGALTKIGGGTLILSGADTYTGATNINAGTLQAGAANVFAPASLFTVASGATLALNNFNESLVSLAGAGNVTLGSGALTLTNASSLFSGVLSGAGSLSLTAGSETLSGVNTYTGGTSLNGGTLVAGNNSALGAGTVTLNGGTLQSGAAGLVLANAFAINTTGGTVDTQANTLTLSGAIGNGNGTTGALTKIGSGTLILSGADTYTGGTTISAGTLQLGNGGAGGSITGNVVDNGIFAINLSNTSTVAGAISGTGSLAQLGSGTTVLSGLNTYSGGTLLTGGVLQATNNFSVGTGTVTLNGGTFQSGATGLMIDNAFAINTTGGTIDTQANTLTLGGPIADGNGTTGILTKIGSGTLILTFNATNTNTTISAGTLQLGNGGGGGSLSGNVVDNGVFAINLFTFPTLAGTISGTGSLAQLGAGRTVLSGVNTYSGGTVLTGGVLQATNNSSVGTGTVTFNGGTFESGAAGLVIANAFAINTTGGTVDTQANTLTLSGAIGNGNGATGALTEFGGGTLILSGADTYTGATNVIAGTLQAGATNALAPASLFTVASGATLALNNFNESLVSLAGAGNVTLGSGALTLTNASSLFSGVLSGAGSLSLTAGSETLSGTNTYSGGTLLTGGVLQATNNSAVGAGTVTLNGGTFQSGAAGLVFANAFAINTTGGTVDTQANTLTLGGPIGNGNGTTGALTKIGSGTLILAGANTYTGPTNINAGTLQAGATNVFAPASLFTVASGATLAFNNFNETIGSLAGAGNVTLGTGMLTLTDASSLFSGMLSGTGTLTLTGTETVTGVSTAFTGTTVIAAGGDLIVGTASSPNAVFGGSVTLESGGALSGHGTILGSINNQGGTVTPGGSIGTLTVNGNYVQGAAGTFVAQLTPAAASLLAVGGTASLNGTLEAAPAAGTYLPTTHYAIITAAGGVSGTFATFINELPSVNLMVDYLPNAVDLVVAGANLIGATPNETAVANTLNRVFMGATGDFATALGAVVALPQSQIPQTLSSLGGQIYGNLAEVSLQDRRLFLGAMDERMRLLGNDGAPGAATLGGLVPVGWGSGANAQQIAALGNAISDPQTAQAGGAPSAGGSAPGGPGLPANVWARGFGQFGSLASNGGALGADYSTGGGAVGAELVHTPGSLLGVAVSGGQSSVSLNTNPESGTISFVQLGAYGAQALGYGAAVDGAVIYSHDFYNVSRGIAGLGRSATSNYGGDDAVVDLGVSRPLQYDAWQITPRAGFSYFHIGQSEFSESGANSLDLTVNPASLDALRSRIGVNISEPLMLGATQVLPELRAAWTHDFLDDRGAFAAAFAGAPGVSFGQVGAATGRDAAELGAGISFAIAQTTIPGKLSAFVQYDATIAAHQTNNAVAAGLKLTW